MTPVSSIFTESSAIRETEARGESPAGYGFRIMTGALAIAIVMLASDSILMLSPWCKSVLSFTLFTALVISRADLGRGPGWLLRLAVHLVGMYAALRLQGPVPRVFAVSWLFLSLYLTGRGSPKSTRRESSGLVQMHWGGLAFAGFLLCYGRIDAVWFDLMRLGEAISWKMPVGLWVSGLPVYLMGAVAGLSGLVSGRPSLRAIARWAAVVAALGVTFVAGRVVLVLAAPVGHADVSALQAGSIICVALIIAGLRLRHPRPQRIAIVSSALTAAVLVPGLVFHLSQPGTGLPPDTAKARGSVGFYSEGLLDWRLPDSERLGLANSGMFGMLRREIGQRGCSAGGGVVVSDSISDEFLSGLHLVIFINPSRRPAPAELAALENFIRDGNAMLVLGDHTDIGDSRRPLNAILAFTGIRFNFDSAVPHRHGWQGCLEIRGHPVNAGLNGGPMGQGDVMTQLAVGASLEIKRPAVPLVIARYGFSDEGDPANGGRGGFMGNMVHDKGEPVGDLVLAASQQVGKGRVLVFGDTSPFQNAALFISRRLVKNSIDWLRGSRAKQDGPVYAAAGGPEAVIDFSLKPDANLELFTERSLGGLANCLARTNISAVPALEGRQWDPEAPLLFLISPTEVVEGPECEWLFRYMESGGNLILAKGNSSPQPVEPLLSRLGLGIEPLPLGGGDSTSALKHKDAWALSLAGTDSATVLSEAFGYPTVVSRPVGAGTFTLIADGRALLDESLEGEWTGDANNINFITDLIRDHLIEDHKIRDHQEKSGYVDAKTQ